MPDLIIYCDKCGKRVPQGDLDGGRAFGEGNRALCAPCAAALSADERAALLRPPSAGSEEPPPAGVAAAGPGLLERLGLSPAVLAGGVATGVVIAGRSRSSSS